MAKRFTIEENQAIFNVVVYEGLEKYDWRKLLKDCRSGRVNTRKINIMNELVEKCFEYDCLQERSQDSVAIQISLCVCTILSPDCKWVREHSRQPIYEKMYKELGLL